jgi:hypothetical protein
MFENNTAFIIAFVIIIIMVNTFIYDENICLASYQEYVFDFVNEYSNDSLIGENVKNIGKSFVEGDMYKFYEQYNELYNLIELSDKGFLYIHDYELRYREVLYKMDDLINE